jgi:hypothetical protein
VQTRQEELVGAHHVQHRCAHSREQRHVHHHIRRVGDLAEQERVSW